MTPGRRVVCAAALAPLAMPGFGWAQSASRLRRIGTLSPAKADTERAQIETAIWLESMRRLGWEVGKNLAVVSRYAEGDLTRLESLAGELVRSDVELIVASLIPAIIAARRVTQSIPIVMGGGVLPVELGLVQSLGRPGGNVTGTVVQVVELAAKTYEFMRELAPRRTRIAHLGAPIPAGSEQIWQGLRGEIARAVQALGMTIEYVDVGAPDNVPKALASVAASRAELLSVSDAGTIQPRLREITGFAIDRNILSAGTFTLFANLGGAMYYGSNLQDIIDRSVSFVDRILRGAKAADLPVELPTKFDLILNLKTLRAIGVTVPNKVLLQASEVIE